MIISMMYKNLLVLFVSFSGTSTGTAAVVGDDDDDDRIGDVGVDGCRIHSGVFIIQVCRALAATVAATTTLESISLSLSL